MPNPTSSGAQTAVDGQSFIPSSKRADGTTRKEIRIRPGYKPPEDVEKYKSRSAEGWRTKGGGGVPGVDDELTVEDDQGGKGKNAKRREAARKKKELEAQYAQDGLDGGVANLQIKDDDVGEKPSETQVGRADPANDEQALEQQKKTRNQLKKLKAVRELKARKIAGDKLSAEQLIKISKEYELIRDLEKTGYAGPELEESAKAPSATVIPD